MIGYPRDKRNFLVNGFRHGFAIPITPFEYNIAVANHPSALANPAEVDKLITSELSLARVAGPFDAPPFHNFHCSPLAIVKKSSGSFRLIHDLSYPYDNSVNSNIPQEFKSVSYETLDDAISLIIEAGQHSLIAKADVEAAFRQLPIHPKSVHLLGFTWRGKFYADRSLPFGLAISCQCYQAFSDSLAWILKHKLNVKSLTYILDDFIFISSYNSNKCLVSLNSFLKLSEEINLPIKHSKTVQPTTLATLHGINVNTDDMTLSLPDDKKQKALDSLALLKSSRSITLRNLQSVVGFLNFVCKVVPMGRAFLRRLYFITRGVRRRHHKIRLTRAALRDIHAWSYLLRNFPTNSLLTNRIWDTSAHVFIFTDSSSLHGYAAVMGKSWCSGTWPNRWRKFHISVLELYPIVLSVLVWGKVMSDKCVIFHTDNEGIVHVINNLSSPHKTLMILIRKLVVATMGNNIMFRAVYFPGEENTLADALSRFQFVRAFQISPRLNIRPCPVPQHARPECILHETF